MSQPITTEIRERVIASANDLYEQTGRDRFPTVDAVRRASRADMNTVSIVMKEWRQSKNQVPVAILVPEAIQHACAVTVATIWQQASELASESLRSAKSAWENERQELEGMRAELAVSFDAQAAELDAAKQQVAALEADAVSRQAELVAAITRADQSDVRVNEIERRVADLRTELDLAHAENERQRAEMADAKQKAASEIEAAQNTVADLRAELTQAQTKLSAQAESFQAQRVQSAAEAQRVAELLVKTKEERDEAIKSASDARERAASLAGQLESMHTQNTSLMDVLRHTQEDK